MGELDVAGEGWGAANAANPGKKAGRSGNAKNAEKSSCFGCAKPINRKGSNSAPQAAAAGYPSPSQHGHASARGR
jgi:hypothetical protein